MKKTKQKNPIFILPEISKMKYQNQIPEPGTTISDFVDNNKKKN
jgi:ATP-dependent Lon protease